MIGTRLLQIAVLVLGTQIAGLPSATAQLENVVSEQKATKTPVDASENPTEELVPQTPSLPSARAALRTFFDAAKSQDWAGAAICLDLSALPSDLSQTARNDLAYKLKEVIDRLEYVNLDEVPAESDWDAAYSIPRDNPTAPVHVARGEDGNWRFTADTVANIEELNKWYKDAPKVAGRSWLAESFRKISPALMKTAILIPNYQWLCLLLLIFLGFLADLITRLVLRHATAAWFRFAKVDDKDRIQQKLWKPMGLLAQALTWYVGTLLIGLPPMALTILLVAVEFFAVVAGVWTAFRLIDVLAAKLAARAAKSQTKFDDLLVPLISRSLKVFAIAIGLIVFAEAFNLPITGLIGGLGIGGAALAFASKDAVSNFFGSVTVLTDRPFEIGDWIITDGAEGSVESVGFRSTRIRTFYNSQITLPNSRLTTAIVDNMGRRRYRRIKTMISLQYDTKPEQVEAFCEGVRELIRRHPYTRKDYYHVYLNAFGESTLEVLLYCFVECPDWSIELREKHRLYLDIMRLADSVGVSLAFPTRTVHLFNEQHQARDMPFDDSDAGSAGQRMAASIAGPLATGNQRPGAVEFVGPSEIGDSASEGPAGARHK
jgi:MscS family membrane protein